MRLRPFRRLSAASRLLGLGAALFLVLPLIALAQGPDEFDSDLDGAWTGTIDLEGKDRGDTLLVQFNLNLEGDEGTVFLLAHERDPDTGNKVMVSEARIDQVTDRRVRLAFDLAEGEDDDGEDEDGEDGGDGDDGEDDDGDDGDDGDDSDDDDPGGDDDGDDGDDDFYTPDPSDGEETENLIVRLTHDAEEGTLSGRLRGDLRGKVTLRRIELDDHPLQRIWAIRIGKGEDERLLLMQLLEDADGESRGRFAATQVTGTAWVGSEQGMVTGERDRKNVEMTVDLPGERIEMSLKLRRRNNWLRGAITTDAGTEGGKLLPIGSHNGKPMKLRRANPRMLDSDALTFVTLRGKNFGRGALVHSDDEDVKIVSVERLNPRKLSVLVDIAASAAGERVGLRVVNGDGQQHRRKNRLRIRSASDDDGDGDAAVSFSADVAPIFAQSCALAGCHSAASAQQGLVLASDVAFENIVNVPSSQISSFDLIEPGDPDDSYLVMKIRGDSRIEGARMPFGRGSLSQRQIDTIVAWVEAEAPNNHPQRQ